MHPAGYAWITGFVAGCAGVDYVGGKGQERGKGPPLEAMNRWCHLHRDAEVFAYRLAGKLAVHIALVYGAGNQQCLGVTAGQAGDAVLCSSTPSTEVIYLDEIRLDKIRVLALEEDAIDA